MRFYTGRRNVNNKKGLFYVKFFDLKSFSIIFFFCSSIQPQHAVNQMCDWNQKCFYFACPKILKQAFLHDSHIWLWGFFTFLVVLAYGAASAAILFMKTCNKMFPAVFIERDEHSWCCDGKHDFSSEVSCTVHTQCRFHDIWLIVIKI